MHDNYDRRTIINRRARRKHSDFLRGRYFKTWGDTEYLFRIMYQLYPVCLVNDFIRKDKFDEL